MRSLLSLLLAPTVLLAAPVPKDKPKVKDDEAVIGSWKIDKFDAGGEKTPGDIDKIRFVFDDKGMLAMSMGNDQKSEGKFKLDPEAKLKTIDIESMGQAMKGLYELDGDTLTLCMPDRPGADRPTEIKADGKARIFVVTFKRVKADEKKEDKKDK
jgi:uncharacterized protein (TIGR03067 family)